ncbi:speract receptor-like [Ptychodera flava]|uniref:speract receptor-like n=1 Tax=Ptychodera flava TaxID=63121 RepID=UPI00396A96C4
MRLVLFIAIVVAAVGESTPTISDDTVKLGLMLPMYGSEESVAIRSSVPGAFDLAVKHVNERNIVQGRTVVWSMKNTNCSTDSAMLDISEFWRDGYAGIVGPGCSCVQEARVASSLFIPLVAYVCEDAGMDDKEVFEYPTFFRVMPHVSTVAQSILALYQYTDWHVTTIIASDEDKYQTTYEAVKYLFENNDIQIKNYASFAPNVSHHSEDTSPFPDIIHRTAKTTRIYLFLGPLSDLRHFAIDMQKMGMLDGDHIIVGTVTDYNTRASQAYTDGESMVDIAKEAFKSVLIIELRQPDLLEDDFQTYMSDMQNRSEIMTGMEPIIWDNRAFLVYDAVMILSRIVDLSITADLDYTFAWETLHLFLDVTFDSITNVPIHLNGSGNAVGEFDLLNYAIMDQNAFEADGSPLGITPNQDRGMLKVGSFVYQSDESRVFVANDRTIEWPGGQMPRAQPECGFDGSLCQVSSVADYLGIILGATVFGVLVILGIATYYYRKKKYEAELDSLVWKIDWDELQISRDQKTAQGFTAKNMALSSLSLLNKDEDAQIFSKIGTYRGKVCAVKFIDKPKIELTREQRIELKLMRDLRHNNINKFIGACPDAPNISILMEYCSKGSLQDILENDSIDLDNMFKASLITDIVKAMVYIHNSALVSHGNLKSSNCVVDKRWVLKITDYGLHEFKSGQKKEELGEDAHCRSLFWRAPEHLRQGNNMPAAGSQKGDVYSFAIIVTEVYSRSQPYNLNDEDPSEIIELLRDPKEPPYRPFISDIEDLAPECATETIKACWSENPLERPTFTGVRQMLKTLHDNMKQNIMDNVIDIMQRYTDNLEELVDERTEELQVQKEKTQQLLFRMLPTSIAAQLIKGIAVLPESYECVTVYFSDIVGFSAMSANSTPHQVVDLLNDLYTLFDGIIENYDVYKVETIGDAYVIVSGLPNKNGIYHAGMIASTALHLLESVKTFKIRHRPDDILKLRIGIHSGPCVACVIGLTNPRYCLFGDTINTTSRMQSNGLALKIHVSPWCKEILDQIGGYALVERGLVAMKGKGEIKTYWLISQDPSYRKEYPPT